MISHRWFPFPDVKGNITVIYGCPTFSITVLYVILTSYVQTNFSYMRIVGVHHYKTEKKRLIFQGKKLHSIKNAMKQPSTILLQK